MRALKPSPLPLIWSGTVYARVAFAGVHRQLERKLANHNWASAFAADPRTEMAGVFDRGAETRQQFVETWGKMPAFDDYGAMLRDVRPDVVCIATRQTMHAEQVEAAVEAGARGILCDKPLATSMAEVDRIVAACRSSGVRLAFGLDRRWVRYYDALVGVLRDGAIGEVRTVVSHGMTNLINHGPHWYDRVLALAGDAELEWVSGWVDDRSGREDDRPGSGHVMFANGVEAFLTSRNFVAGFDMSFDLIGSEGRIAVVSDGKETKVWSPRAVEISVAEKRLGEPWPRIVADLFDAVQQDRPTACDVEHARRASEIGFAIHQSHRGGGHRVRVDEIDRGLRVPSFPWGNE
jgi:predicted dehydrogenase